MVAPPRVNLRGVVTTADPRKMSHWAEREIGWVLENRWNSLCRGNGSSADVDWVGVQREIEVGLQRRMRRELQVEPLIICLVQAAPAGTPAVRSRQERHHDRSNSSNGNGNGSNGNGNGAASDDSRQRRRRPSATVG